MEQCASLNDRHNQHAILDIPDMQGGDFDIAHRHIVFQRGSWKHVDNAVIQFRDTKIRGGDRCWKDRHIEECMTASRNGDTSKCGRVF